MIRAFVGDPKWIALRGAAALVFGVATMVWPDVTLLALVLLWGAFVLVDGLFALTAAVVGDGIEHRVWMALYGAAGVTVGVVTFLWPSITGRVLLFLIAVWAFVVGVIQLVVAFNLRKEIAHEWALGVAGALTVALAVVLVVWPGATAVAIAWVIGLYATLLGLLLLAVAWAVHSEIRRLEPRGGPVRPGGVHPAV
jgi:uncharacterized membrane protein HdeD (DUF308 family)